ncbi:phosphonate C-P lyase system protein PhnH [Paracoccaceae bacterium]
MITETLSGGFADPAPDAARAFRQVLQALARPGRIEILAGALPPAPLSVAAGVVALVLVDGTVPVHLAGALDCPAVRDWLRFHCGARLVGAEEASLAFGTPEALNPLGRFAIGTAEYPDRAATLVIEVPRLAPEGAILRGPGIDGMARLSLPAPADFATNAALFPLGFDSLLTCGAALAGLPRSTRVEGF